MPRYHVRKDEVGDHALFDTEQQLFSWIWDHYIRDNVPLEDVLAIERSSPDESPMFMRAETIFKGTAEECLGYMKMMYLLEGSIEAR